jgi:hypothetical protein
MQFDFRLLLNHDYCAILLLSSFKFATKVLSTLLKIPDDENQTKNK